MAATVEIGGSRAAIMDGVWSSDNKVLLDTLNLLLDPLGPSGADPNPDLHTAQAAVARLGGELIDYDKTAYVEGRVY